MDDPSILDLIDVLGLDCFGGVYYKSISPSYGGAYYKSKMVFGCRGL
jgi:hypothetical protein